MIVARETHPAISSAIFFSIRIGFSKMSAVGVMVQWRVSPSRVRDRNHTFSSLPAPLFLLRNPRSKYFPQSVPPPSARAIARARIAFANARLRLQPIRQNCRDFFRRGIFLFQHIFRRAGFLKSARVEKLMIVRRRGNGTSKRRQTHRGDFCQRRRAGTADGGVAAPSAKSISVRNGLTTALIPRAA
jgi:hypothetical protein